MKPLIYIGAIATAIFASGAAFGQAQAPAGPALKLCTGTTSGKYYEAGTKLASSLKDKVNVTVLPSAGSDASLRRMEKAGEADGCDAAIVQSDALIWYSQTYKGNALKIERVQAMYPEYVHLVCNKNAGIDKIKDFYGTKDKRIAIGKPGSGTQITWSNFVKAEKRYEAIPTADQEGTLAENKVKSGDTACIMFTAGLGTGTMKRINDNNTGELILIPLNDGDLTNAKDEKGKPIYRWSKIPGGTYKSLQTGTFSTSVDTVVQDAVLIANTAWAEANERAYTDLSAAATRLAKQMAAE
jgi:TRAP transporter TAXI family solute receptor